MSHISQHINFPSQGNNAECNAMKEDHRLGLLLHGGPAATASGPGLQAVELLCESLRFAQPESDADIGMQAESGGGLLGQRVLYVLERLHVKIHRLALRMVKQIQCNLIYGFLLCFMGQELIPYQRCERSLYRCFLQQMLTGHKQFTSHMISSPLHYPSAATLEHNLVGEHTKSSCRDGH